MLLIGEGTADIQRMIIGRRLLEDYKLLSGSGPASSGRLGDHPVGDLLVGDHLVLVDVHAARVVLAGRPLDVDLGGLGSLPRSMMSWMVIRSVVVGDRLADRRARRPRSPT